MNIKEKFDEFICGKYDTFTGYVPNKDRTIETMKNKLNEFEEGNEEKDYIKKIEEYIIANKSIHMKNIQLKFYKYLKEKYNKEVDTELENVKLNILPKERQIDILKNFHCKTTRKKLSKIYGVSERTIYEDLDSLEKGIVFMDTEIKVNFNNKKSEFEDTVHPIFLALNLTEVNLLMNFLPEILEEYKQNCYDSFKRKRINRVNTLINKMKIQLSDYAVGELNIDCKNIDKTMKFTSEKEFIKKDDNYLDYLLKAERKTRSFLINGIEYEGNINYDDDGYFIFTTDNEIIRINKDEDDIKYKKIKLIDDYEQIWKHTSE